MMKRYIIVATAISAFFGCVAQEQLSKEITIEREIVPEQRAALRLNVFPRQQMPVVNPVSIGFSETTQLTTITPMIAQFEPAATVPAVEQSPYRGYVDLGYFPVATVGLSAGYGVISNENTRLDVWGQFNNNSYDGGSWWQTLKRMDAAAGICFSNRFGRSGKLDLSTEFRYSNFSEPWNGYEWDWADSQTALRWNIDGLWSGRATDVLTYNIGARFGLFNFGKALDPSWDPDAPRPFSIYSVKPVHETHFGVNGGVATEIDSRSSFGLDLDASFLSYDRFLDPEADLGDMMRRSERMASVDGKTLGLITVVPNYTYRSKVASARVGVKLDVGFNSGKAIHIAPDVTLGFNPVAEFGAWAKFGGGEYQNDYESLFTSTPYFNPAFAYGNSHIPFTGEVGFRAGPFHGASLTLSAAYAAVNDWLMPTYLEGEMAFMRENLRCWHLEARLRWELRSYLELEASYEMSPGNGDKSVWYGWRDRARNVAGVSAIVRPFAASVGSQLSSLEFTLGYSIRFDREMLCAVEAELPDGSGCVGWQIESALDLGNMDNLWFGASYRFTKAFTVFARCENILDKRSRLIFNIPSQGFTGLVGVGLKF